MKYIERYIELYFKDQLFSNLLTMQGDETNIQFTRIEKLILYSLHNKKMNMGEISGLFKIPNSTANFIINKFKKNELVRTMKNERDKRIIEVELTEKGYETLNKILKNLDDRFSEMVANIIAKLEAKATNEDVEAFKRCINILLS